MKGPLDQPFDVVIVGAGNAALCAAMTVRKAGATVLLPESATMPYGKFIHAVYRYAALLKNAMEKIREENEPEYFIK